MVLFFYGNKEIYENVEGVLIKIIQYIDEKEKTTPSPPYEGGDYGKPPLNKGRMGRVKKLPPPSPPYEGGDLQNRFKKEPY
jgi:hypothetical protein